MVEIKIKNNSEQFIKRFKDDINKYNENCPYNDYDFGFIKHFQD